MSQHSDTASAVTAYHNLLQATPQLAADSAAMLQTEQPGLKLTFGGSPLCSVLRPQFLSLSTYAYVQRDACALATAMFRLAHRVSHDRKLQDALGLTLEERDLIAIDPGFRDVSPTSRLDSFMAGDAWYFVEYNAETPAAIAYEDVLSELFARMPVMAGFSKQYTVTPLPARGHLLDTLLDSYRQWGGRVTPCIAIVDWKDLPTATEHTLFCEFFSQHGLDALIVEPAELEYTRGRLHAAGRGIDLVYRRVLTSELLAQPDVAKPLIEAYRNHDVCVVNSFRAKSLHKKAIFSLLTDDAYANLLTDAEQSVVAAHIPWTRTLTDTKTTYQGNSVDLLPFVLEQREGLVLKPNDEYGGKGVVMGWETAPEDWERALATAVETPSVAQERVPVERDLFPVWEQDELQWVELTPDIDPFLFGTSVRGVLTRLSAAALLNVTAGTGSLAPTFLVEPA